MTIKTIFTRVLQLLSAAILLQTLYFKFTGHAESVELFTKLVGPNLEAYARIGTGVFELICSVLLLFPRTAFIGALMGAGLMAGAIMSHLLVIGIESKGDGGQLFVLAIVVLVCCLALIYLFKKEGLDLYRLALNVLSKKK
jgi:putative oxidoreductase